MSLVPPSAAQMSPVPPSAAWPDPGHAPMNMRQIEVFRAFMLTGSISDAARLLGVSQPAVSSMLHHIQSRSGIRLFEQMKGRLLPTPEAHTLFDEVKTAWKSVERVHRLCQDLARARSGMLRIAASTSLGVHVIPFVVRSLDQDFPRLSVSLELFTPPLLVDCLVSGEADVGVAAYRIEHPSILTRPVGMAPIVCAMLRDHPLAHKRVVALSDLAGEILVTHSYEMPEGSLIAEALRSADVTPRSHVQVRSGQSACWFVRAGAGVALLDATTVAGGAFPDVVVRPVDPPMFLRLSLLRSQLRSSSKPALAFAARIEEYCRREFPEVA